MAVRPSAACCGTSTPWARSCPRAYCPRPSLSAPHKCIDCGHLLACEKHPNQADREVP